MSALATLIEPAFKAALDALSAVYGTSDVPKILKRAYEEAHGTGMACCPETDARLIRENRLRRTPEYVRAACEQRQIRGIRFED